MILTIQQRQALDAYLAVAWSQGSWELYTEDRRATLSWALAGADEQYRKAILRYLDTAWAQKQEEAK
jgi:hypothetical protein